MSRKDSFTSHFGFIISVIATAIGAGNIWRFSRVVAQNGSGAFLIAWVIFLFTWSIPLIISEIALGKWSKKAPMGALTKAGGPKMAWMGGFVAVVTTVILFYYSVVVGWGITYVFYALFGLGKQSPEVFWNQYTHSFYPFVSHAVAIGLGCLVIYKGISHGIEKCNKFLIPILFVCIILMAIRAFTLPNATLGLNALFSPHLEKLKDYQVWLEALTQNAWDTGAGWGLILVLAGFARRQEKINSNSFITGLANNGISLLMGMIIFSFAFSVDPSGGIQALTDGQGSTGTGLTFVYLPKLFQSFPGAAWMPQALGAVFFLSFAFAAFSSMLPMIQVAMQSLQELGIKKNHALMWVGFFTLLGGLPSALSQVFFENQDSVWSLGLVVNGLFIALGILKFGPKKFREKHINQIPGDMKIGRWYDFTITWLIPIQAVVLISWFVYQSMKVPHPLDPFKIFSLGSLILQWSIPLILLKVYNSKLARQLQ